MNTESLEYFIKVYEKRSLNAAARDLFITPQGLSKMIKQLELDLETELFYRGTRGMMPTEYGELLYSRAKHICYLIEDIKKEISIMSGNKEVLNLMSTYSASSTIPMNLLFEFSEKYPNIKMKLKEVPDEHPIMELFEEDKIDVGLIIANEKFDSCDYELILNGQVVIVVSKDHPLANKDKISIKELENEALILKSVDEREEHCFISKCLECGFRPQIKYEIGNSTTAHMICNSEKIASVSIDFLERTIKDDRVKIIMLEEKINQNMYLVTKKRTIQSRVVSLFKVYINEYILSKISPFNDIKVN